MKPPDPFWPGAWSENARARTFAPPPWSVTAGRVRAFGWPRGRVRESVREKIRRLGYFAALWRACCAQHAAWDAEAGKRVPKVYG